MNTTSRSRMPAAALRSDDPPELLLAFAPLHKRAFGVGVGLAAAIVGFGITAIPLVRGLADHSGIALLSQLFPAYTVTWSGAFIGAFWSGVMGFVAGWFTAFCRNLALALSLVVLRARTELAATRDFLDHI